MTEPLVFVSYSRREYFFTESLVLHLQRRGINAWFDAHQIEPGIGWKTDIQDGLENSKALVFVASRTSLESPYVKQELQTVSGVVAKPIYIVLFEPVTLPPELAHSASVIDFMQGFDRGIELLVKGLQDGVQHHDPVPDGRSPYLPMAVQRFTDLLRLPVIVWWMLLAATVILIVKLATVVLGLAAGGAEMSSVLPATLIFVPLLTGIVLLSLLSDRGWITIVSRIRQRDNARFELWVKAWRSQVNAAWLLVLLAAAYGVAFQSLVFALLLLPAGYLVFNYTRGAGNREWYQLLFNPDLLRWCHLGNDVPYDWRIVLNQALLPDEMAVDVISKIVKHTDNETGQTTEQEVITGIFVSVKGAKPTPKTYRLYDSPQIQDVSAYIQGILKKNAFQAIDDETTAPDYHILLLSPWTPVAAAEALIREHPNNTLPLLVAPANLHPLPEITRLQLVDFRKRYEPLLASALQYLHTQDATHRSIFSIGVLPVQINNVFPLVELRRLQRVMIFTASLCFFAAVIGIISLIYKLVFSAPNSPADYLRLGLSGLVYALQVGAGVWLRRNADDIGNLVPKSRRRLRFITVGIVLLLAGMFVFGLQPRFIDYGVARGDEMGWRIANVVFISVLGSWLVGQLETAIRRGCIIPEPQPILGMPLTSPQGIMVHVRQFAMMAVGYTLAFISVVMVVGRDDQLLANGAHTTELLIGGIVVALICVGLVTNLIWVTPALMPEDPAFAFTDARFLRTRLQHALRKGVS